MSQLGDDINANLKTALQKRQPAASPTPAYGGGAYDPAGAATFPSPGPTQSPSFSESSGGYDAAALQDRMNKMRDAAKQPAKKKQETVGEKYPATDPGQSY